MSFPESTPEITRWCALIIAIACLFPTALSLVSAIQAERTGIALYSPNPRLPATDRVTRAASPDKFQQAVFASWLYAFTFGGISIFSFFIYRRLSN